MNDPDTLFDTGMYAVVGALGVAAGMLTVGGLSFAVYCALVAVGLGVMTASMVMRERQHRRQSAENWRQFEILQANMPRAAVEREIVKRELRQLEKMGRA